MSSLWERSANAVLVLSALAVAGAAVHREYRDKRPVEQPASSAPTLMGTQDWDNIRRLAIPLGDTSGRVTVVEFADFECPYCQAFDARVRALMAERPGLIARRFIHFPLRNHRFALPAARAAECANVQGSFVGMHDALFAKQDSLGLKSWGSYARDAGVQDTAQIIACSATALTPTRVEAGISLGRRIGVHSTPTVIINGWRFEVPPNDTVLRESVLALADGKMPPSARRK